MSTYAVYRVWAGVLTAELPNNLFVKQILHSYKGVKKDDFLFEGIYMHGRNVGMGVKIQELNWEMEIEDKNLYDVAIANEASKTLRRVTETLKKLGVSAAPRLYHHIDLGG